MTPLRALHLRSFLAIALLDLLVYFPTFGHTARSDQIAYLAHTSGTEGLVPLATKFYAYDRIREFNVGDELLFRPVYFFVLGAEQWLFGHRFALWQAVSLLLHLGVVGSLIGLLLEIRPTIVAPLLAGFFSVIHLSAEMVYWHHLQPYLVCLLLLIGALSVARRHAAEGQTRRSRLALLLVLATLATFTYELALIVDGLLAVYLLASPRTAAESGPRPLPRWSGALLLAPCVLYAACSLGDAAFRDAAAREPQRMDFRLSPGRTLVNLAAANAFWFDGGILPHLIDAFPIERTYMDPRLFLTWGDRWSVSNAFGVFLVAAALLALVRLGRASRPPPEERRFIALVALSLIAYELMIVVGRLNPRGCVDTLRTNSYYSYVFWVFLTILIHSAVDLDWLLADRRLRRLALGLLIVCLAGNAVLTHRLGRAEQRWAAPRNRFVAEIESLRSRGADRSAFVPLAAPDYPGNLTVSWLKPRNAPASDLTLAEILYPRIFRRLRGP